MKFSPHLALIVGVLAVSTASTLIRLAQSDLSSISPDNWRNSLSVAAWRLTIASLILAPFAFIFCRKEWRNLTRHDWLLISGSGMLLSVHFFFWITSLSFTSVAASVVLVTTAPLFVGIVSHLFLKERLTKNMISALAMAMIGSTVIGLGDLSGTHGLVGDALAILGAVAVAGYFLIGRDMRRKLSLLGYVFPVYSTAAIALMYAAALSHAPLTGISYSAWLYLFLMALVPQVIGHSSLNWALGNLSATYVTMSVLAEPIGATILAWAVLGEVPPLFTILGGCLILTGISLAGKTT